MSGEQNAISEAYLGYVKIKGKLEPKIISLTNTREKQYAKDKIIPCEEQQEWDLECRGY